jgi:hypothetical protein
MTERPLSITTQIATSNQAVLNPTALTVTGDALPPMLDSAGDEEPYTIKCICEYNDDDGNTIYCEQCDTWQHTECYYPGRISEASRADFQHACVDCKPRDLNFEDATARQRSNRENKIANDNGDKKTKRPQSKSHKKKSKPAELQVNGFVDHDKHKNGSPQDHHPQTKKMKGHRSNQSVGSQIKRSPPFNARPHPHAHPPSPAHTPPDFFNTFQVHAYSDRFLTLYDHDPPTSSTNTFASLEVTNSMSLWLHDPEKLEQDAGCRKEDVFQRLKVAFDELRWPELRPVTKEATINDTTLRWRYLTAPGVFQTAGRITELNGFVGFQRDYCQDVQSRWHDAPHPQPFVFFHPRLPLYIDTRQEGSTCRFVRRSCRANTALETFIAGGGSEYHFWLISERHISPGEQLTIPWDFRFPSNHSSRYLQLLNLGDDDAIQFDNAEATDEEYEQLSQLIQLVLSDHGGCACELGSDCAFLRFHRSYHARSHPQSNGVRSKKGRKPRQNHISPTSTGHATNSRAASEGQGDTYDEDDNRSTSGSSRSKPQSRDLTPAHGTNETNGILTEPTDREKRKIAMLEDSFKKMEQERPPKKKKRASDGSNVTVPIHTTPQSSVKPRQKSVARMSISQPSASTVNGQRARQYADASTSRRQSDSPFSAVSPTGVVHSPTNAVSHNGSMQYRSRQVSAAPKPTYVDSTTQTDEVEKAWWNRPPARAKRAIVPLGKRLLRNRQKIQEQQDLQQAQVQSFLGSGFQSEPSSPTMPMDLDHQIHDEGHGIDFPAETKGRNISISSSTPSVDISAPSDFIMSDVPTVAISNHIKPPPPPWPSQIASVPVHISSPPMQRSPDLQLQLPPTPSLSSPGFSGPPSASATPSSATGTLIQSPFGTFSGPTFNSLVQQASPIKTTKKLSLSDYKAARMKKSDTNNASKPSSGGSPVITPTVLRPSLSTIEEVKSHGMPEGSAIVDSPTVEGVTNPLAAMAPETVARE